MFNVYLEVDSRNITISNCYIHADRKWQSQGYRQSHSLPKENDAPLSTHSLVYYLFPPHPPTTWAR